MYTEDAWCVGIQDEWMNWMGIWDESDVYYISSSARIPEEGLSCHSRGAGRNYNGNPQPLTWSDGLVRY